MHAGQPLAAHTDMYVHLYAHMASRRDYTNKDPEGEWVFIAEFYNCPKEPGLLEMSFRVLHTAVHDVAFNPERHVLSSQRQPLAASSSSIPARGEEDAVLAEAANLPVDASVLM